MRNQAMRTGGVLTLFAVLLPLTGCDEIVYRDRPIDEPVTAAQGFLGYANASQKLTMCGQCHSTFQRQWSETAHSGAWATLQASAGNQALCEGCHTTNSRGNVIEGETGGYYGHQNERYFDVQCEACHGPGLGHATAPTRENWPLAPLAVGEDLQAGCGECHTGAHQPFVEQWASSRHANVRPAQASNPACSSCHRGQDALVQFGVNAMYLERGSAEHLPITCGVCHDPHDATNPAQLRLAINVPSEESNLCMQCHHKRGTPDPTTFRGPHSPEGPVLLGVAGWWPPNMDNLGEIVATHGSEANPRLCAGCHVNKWEIRDEITNEFVFRSTGHTFEAIPCVDPDGVPTGERDCSLGERTFRTCTEAGCHGSESVARGLITIVRSRLSSLAAVLEAMEADVPAGEFDQQDNRYTTAEGSRFNRELAQVKGSEIHNPWLIESLLRASIEQMQIDYGITPPPGVNLSQELGAR
jgi:predicted CXXCH cytochrome family protein